MARLSASSSAATTDGHITPSISILGDSIPRRRISLDVDSVDHEDSDDDPTSDSSPVRPDPTLIPGGSRDLSFIGLQAFILGLVTSGAFFLTALLIFLHSSWWRLPAFFICLGIFHFLEYWTTAAYNPPACRASSFLLFNNGRAYTVAHAMATIEIFLSNFFPRYQQTGIWNLTIVAGIFLIIIGQIARSVAMKQAGTNFNHLVATEHKKGHVLIRAGLYGYLRHPSYFGFFWWALGTQLLVGNKVCLVGYAVVLWRFFNHRIRIEETHLISFFGEEYDEYRKNIGTRIPFIA